MVLRYVTPRYTPRTSMVCSISVSFQSCTIHGIVRDISAGGIFVYLNSKLPLHTKVDFSLRLQDGNVTGSGEVIRIEESTPGAAIGVVIKISRYNPKE